MRLFNIINGICQYLAARNKTLWSGKWASGAITVPGSSKYSTFIVNINGNECFCSKNVNGTICASSSFRSSTDELVYEDVFMCETEGDVWTLVHLGEIGHKFDSDHTVFIPSPAIWVGRIIGLDPIAETIGGGTT